MTGLFADSRLFRGRDADNHLPVTKGESDHVQDTKRGRHDDATLASFGRGGSD